MRKTTFSVSDTVRDVATHFELGGRLTGLTTSFQTICDYLKGDPTPSPAIQKKVNNYLKVETGVRKFATAYLNAFTRVDYPKATRTTPDEMVSLILHHEFGVAQDKLQAIQLDHQRCMSIENCIGNLLERYIDETLYRHGWHWCCGNTVPSADFLYRSPDGEWHVLQIKNRSNSENSSSSKIRSGTNIQHWFRTFAYSNRTNWENVPKPMQNLGLSETNFRKFVLEYLKEHRPLEK